MSHELFSHAAETVDEPLSLSNGALTLAPPSVVESMTRAEVDMQITTAKRYPRILSTVKKRMLDLATLDEETAASCFYRLSRSGKPIEGPSIRLAEIAASSFGNMRAAAQIVDNDGKTITARGVCHDLETNSCFAVEVKRRITDKSGRTYNDDMQVTTGNAACSIALRNAIFRTVPFALIKPIYERAKSVAVGNAQTLSERRGKMLKAFAAMGVNEGRLLAGLGKVGVDDIGLDDLAALIGIHTAVKDGEQSVDDAFPAVPSKPKDLPRAVALPSAAPVAPAPAPADAPLQETPPVISDDDLVDRLGELCRTDKIAATDVDDWAIARGMLAAGKQVPSLPPKRLRTILEGWETVKYDIALKRAGTPAGQAE